MWKPTRTLNEAEPKGETEFSESGEGFIYCWVLGFQRYKLNKETSEDKEFLVPMRLGDTPVSIPNTMVKT